MRSWSVQPRRHAYIEDFDVDVGDYEGNVEHRADDYVYGDDLGVVVVSDHHQHCHQHCHGRR